MKPAIPCSSAAAAAVQFEHMEGQIISALVKKSNIAVSVSSVPSLLLNCKSPGCGCHLGWIMHEEGASGSETVYSLYLFKMKRVSHCRFYRPENFKCSKENVWEEWETPRRRRNRMWGLVLSAALFSLQTLSSSCMPNSCFFFLLISCIFIFLAFVVCMNDLSKREQVLEQKT